MSLILRVSFQIPLLSVSLFVLCANCSWFCTILHLIVFAMYLKYTSTQKSVHLKFSPTVPFSFKNSDIDCPEKEPHKGLLFCEPSVWVTFDKPSEQKPSLQR